MGPESRGDRAGALTDPAWWSGLFAAIDGRDVPAFLAYLCDDVEFRFGSANPVLGLPAVGAAVGAFFGMIAGCRHTVHRTWSDGASAVCHGDVTYTRTDGSSVTLPFANILYLRDSSVARYLIYCDLQPLFSPGPD